MPLIIAIVVVIAIALAITCRRVYVLDYRRAHPTLEKRRQMLLDKYSSTDMSVEEYEQQLEQLEKEEK